MMEEKIMLEVDYRCTELTEKIDSSGGEIELDVSHMLDITVGNEKEEKFFKLKGIVDATVESISILDLMLSEKHYKLPMFRNRVERQIAPIKKLFDFFDEQISERLQEIRQSKRDIETDPEDFVDAFLAEIKENENVTATSFTLESLKHTLFDLWVAGQDTTANTLYWALSYMTANPQCIVVLQNELDSVTQKTRPLSLQDRPKTPYLNAVITEVLRCSSIVPMNLWREATEDFSIREYQIPKGTATVAQISVIMRDEKIFPNFEDFNPQRYIDHPEYEQHAVSFGLGKRSCLGESLARAELYLILGNLMCRFNFKASTTMPSGMAAKCGTSPGRKAKDYKQYGPVFTFWMGYKTTVNICDYQMAQDVMVKKGQAFINRFVPTLVNFICKGLGIVNSNGLVWQEQRRFALHSLRNFGLGRNIMEDRIMLEVDYRSTELNDKIDSAGGEVELNMSHMLEILVGNVINRMLFTDRFTKEREATFFKLKEILDESSESISVLDLMLSEKNYKLPFFKGRMERQLASFKGITDFLDEQIQERLKELKDGKRQLKDEPENFVDAYLAEMKNSENEQTSFIMDALKQTLFDLWLAGQDTTATTLYWAFSYITANPQILGNLMCRFNFKGSASSPPGMEAKCPTSHNRNAKEYEVVINRRNTK